MRLDRQCPSAHHVVAIHTDGTRVVLSDWLTLERATAVRNSLVDPNAFLMVFVEADGACNPEPRAGRSFVVV
jgi:hypothetical protein